MSHKRHPISRPHGPAIGFYCEYLGEHGHGIAGPPCTSHQYSTTLFLNKLCEKFTQCKWVNTLRSRQNGRRFPDDIFKCIFVNENIWISIKFSLKFVPKGPINNIPALVQIIAWCRPGDKPLSEPTLVSLLTHICVTRPQWVKATPCWTRKSFSNPNYVHRFLM